MGVEELVASLGDNILTTTLGKVIGWGRGNSVWPAQFGLACCAIEMIATATAGVDIARFGSEAFRASPRQSDLMIVSGRVSQKMAPILRTVYDQMPEPKWVISMGACASTAARRLAERADDSAGADQGPGNHSAAVIAEDLVIEKGVTAGDQWVTVPAERIREALSALKADGYRLLVFLTCVDHLVDSSREFPARYEVVYQLRDLDAGRAQGPLPNQSADLRIRTFIDGDPPRIDSVHDIFPPANWEERETYDMFGIVFTDHPGLTRILMPDDWVGHPLRRDYPVGGEVVEFSEEHEIWQTAPDEA